MGLITDRIKHVGVTVSGEQTAAITDFTDSTSGDSTTTTLAEGVGQGIWTHQISLADVADGDVLTTFTPGFHGQIDALDFVVGVPVTTAAKASTLNMEIGTTNLTGGTVALTSANCTPQGAEVAGAAVTAANVFTATDTLSVEASSTTAFAEGDGMLVITYTNLDTADAVSGLNTRVAELTAVLENKNAISE